MSAKSFTIVAGGPSIESLDLEAEKVGTVVAINRAFYRFPEHTDVWVSGESPHPMVKQHGYDLTRKLVRLHEPKIWCPREPFLEFWRSEFTYTNKAPLFIEPFDLWPQETKPYTHLRPPWHSDNFWCYGSTLMALALVLHRAPEYVKVLGADMEGVGGWGYDEAKHPESWWQERWRRESEGMEQAIREAAMHGVDIDLVQTSAAGELVTRMWGCSL